ncbi:MAG TPA: LamG domain-containing protein [Candidatus Saccharimonadales bacterium]|nr:LamG domain-containing protein [Candidatus Saccharimonadales bacterium]
MPRLLTRDMGTALKTNTTNDTVNIGAPSFITSAFTVGLWVKRLETNYIIASIGYNNGSDLGYLIRNSGNNLVFYSGNNALTLAPSIPLGAWTHLAVTYDGVNAQIFINGALANTIARPTRTFTGNFFWFAERGITAYRTLFDEAYVINRAITLQEVQDSMQGKFPTDTKGLYKFDEGSGLVANDSSGNGRTGTIVGATYSTDVAIKPRALVAGRYVPRNIMASLQFNGSTSKVTMAQNANLPIFSQAGYSVAGRFLIGTGGGAQGSLYSEGNSTSDNQLFFIGYQPPVNKMVVTVRNNAGVAQLSAVNASTVLPVNSGWHDFVWTDNNGICKLYIDGVLDATNFNYTPSGVYTFNRSSLGFIDRFSPASFYRGSLSAFRVYNRVLSDQDAANFHAMQSPSDGLVGHWMLDEGAGAVAYDTVNGNHGVVAGASYTSDSPSLGRPSSNLIYNGSVDYAPKLNSPTNTNVRWIDGTAGGSITNDLFGWALAALTGSGSAMFDSSKKNSGTYSLKLSTTAVASEVNVYGTTTPATPAGVKAKGIPVTPGVSYTGSVYIETLANGGSAASGAQLDFVERMADGTYVTSNIVTAGAVTSPMQKYSITFTPNASTRYITPKLIVKGNNGANTLIMDAWFDDITLTQTNPPSRQLIV